jgi:predicted DNA-binding transcriptional regulator AlpA
MYLTDKQVADRFGVNRVTVWRWRKTDPTFPRPVQLSPGCVRFKLAELEVWEATRTAA